VSFFSDERAAELRELFFETAQELLQVLNEQGLELEKRPADEEVVRNLRRTVHTLKGDSAACGFRELSELAHELEDVLTPEMAGRAGTALAQVVLSAADMFDALAAAYRGKMQPPNGDPLRTMIARLAQKPAPGRPESSHPAFSWSEYEQLTIQKTLDSGSQVFNIAVTIDPACPMPAAGAQLVLNVLGTNGTILARRPEEVSGEAPVERLEVALSSVHAADWLEGKCKIPTVVERVFVRPWTADVNAQPPREALAREDLLEIATQKPSHHPSTFSLDPEDSILAITDRGVAAVDLQPAPVSETTLRVDAERIDAVMNLVGELIIGKSMLHQAVMEFGRRFPKDPLHTRFSDAMSHQAQMLNSLQRSVMKIRMVPVEQLFRRLPRIIRDTAKRCGKEVEMRVSGQETDLDKSILDALAEPLTHLVRNAVDHGIELPQEREAAGKTPRGTIQLDAYHQANHVVIEVTDDGAGIDPQRVVAKAVERGVISPEDAARLSEQQKLELIFESGFSTAEEVTEVSGRGVGMDIVRSVLSRLKGEVSIESKIGRGTTFRLTLPLTLAIIKALLFRVGKQIYAVPLGAVVEITRAGEEDVHLVENQEVLRLREQLVTLIRLSRMRGGETCPQKSRFFLVVVAVGDHKFGLIVDQLVGEDELVIKALDDHLVATELVSGASILGDGTVVLILNLQAVVEKLGRTTASQIMASRVANPKRVEASA